MPAINIKFKTPATMPDDVWGAAIVRSTVLKSEKEFQDAVNDMMGPPSVISGGDQESNDIDGRLTFFSGWSTYMSAFETAEQRTALADSTLIAKDESAETGKTYWYCVLAVGAFDTSFEASGTEEGTPWFRAGVFSVASSSEIAADNRTPSDSSVASISLGAVTSNEDQDAVVTETVNDTVETQTTDSSGNATTFAGIPHEVVINDDTDSGILRDGFLLQEEIKKAVAFWASILSNAAYSASSPLKVFVFARPDYTFKSCRNRLSPIYTEAATPIGSGFAGVMPGSIVINIDEDFLALQSSIITRQASNGESGEMNSYFYHIIRREVLRGLGIGDQYFGIGGDSLSNWAGGVQMEEVAGVYYYKGVNGVNKYNELFTGIGDIPAANTNGIPIEWRSTWICGSTTDRDTGIEGAFATYGSEGPYFDELNSLNTTHAYLGGQLTAGEISVLNPLLDKTWYSASVGPAVSAITLGVLKDRNFTVDYNRAETYTPSYEGVF